MSGKPIALLFVFTMAWHSDRVQVDAFTDVPSAIVQPPDAVWTQQTAWQLSREPVVQIKGSEDRVEEAPLDPVRAFRLPDGRYVVGDGDQNGWDALLAYDRQGKFLAKWGRDGSGPGEFRQLFHWAGSYRGDSIAAYDQGDRTLEIYSRDGKFGRALKLPNTRPTTRATPGTFGFSDVFIGVFRDGSVLRFEPINLDVSTGEGLVYYQPALMIYDANGQNPTNLGPLRTLSMWWNGQLAQQYIYQPRRITIAGQDHWYHGTTENITVHMMDKQGHEVRVLRRPFTRERVTAEDREAFMQTMLGQMRGAREGGGAAATAAEQRLRANSRFAEYKPAFSNIVEDVVGNVWIEHFRWIEPDQSAPNPRPSRWSVFDRQGKYQGDVQMPASFLVSSITSDQVIGFFKDEFDVEHVHIYSLIKPQ
jgi:hypothetical protein